MTFKSIATAYAEYSAARSTLVQIYRDVVDTERKYVERLPQEKRDAFRKSAHAAYRYSGGRQWGSTDFKEHHIEDVVFNENDVTISFVQDDYCRGCYMGQNTDQMSIPDYVFDSYSDEDYSGDRAAAACMRFVEELVEIVNTHAAKKAAEDAEKAEKERLAKEAEERAEYERLRSKYVD